MKREWYGDATFSNNEISAVTYALKEEFRRGAEWLAGYDPEKSDLPYSTVQILCETHTMIQRAIEIMEAVHVYAIQIPEDSNSDSPAVLQDTAGSRAS